MSELGLGLIECGRIPSYRRRPVIGNANIELVDACDLDRTKIYAYSREFPIPNYSEMCSRHSIICIVEIDMASGVHYEHVLDTLEKCNKHVILDKPTVLKPSHAGEL